MVEWQISPASASLAAPRRRSPRSPCGASVAAWLLWPGQGPRRCSGAAAQARSARAAADFPSAQGSRCILSTEPSFAHRSSAPAAFPCDSALCAEGASITLSASPHFCLYISLFTNPKYHHLLSSSLSRWRGKSVIRPMQFLGPPEPRPPCRKVGNSGRSAPGGQRNHSVGANQQEDQRVTCGEAGQRCSWQCLLEGPLSSTRAGSCLPLRPAAAARTAAAATTCTVRHGCTALRCMLHWHSLRE